MAVKIRLKRFGKIRAPYYRIVVADSRTKRDGRVIEEIGKYHPTEEPSLMEVDSARAQYWLGVGAQPSEQVLVILKITGDWQKFKGLPGTEGTLRTKVGSADAADAIKSAADAAEKAKAKAADAKEKAAAVKAAAAADAKAAADAAAAADAKADADAAAAAADAAAAEVPVEVPAEVPVEVLADDAAEVPAEAPADAAPADEAAATDEKA